MTATYYSDLARFSDFRSAGVALQPSGNHAKKKNELGGYVIKREALRTRDSSANNQHYATITSAQLTDLARPFGGMTVSAMPTAVGASWWRLAMSGLPETVFSELLRASTSPARLLNQSAPLSTKSLDLFLDLWDAVKPFAAEPVVSITPKGYVVAEWLRDENNFLAVLASSNDTLIYSLFTNGRPTEGSVDRLLVAGFAHGLRRVGQDPFSWSDA